MKVLITGAAGFIGYHVSLRLINDGHQVTGLDNMFDNGDLDLKFARLAQLGIDANDLVDNAPHRSAGHDFTFIKADVLDLDYVLSLCEKECYDTVVHLAAAGNGLSNSSSVYYLQTNINGTQNMLEAALRAHAKQFFFSSTSAVYGTLAKSPLKEDDDVDTPLSLYGGCKRMCEILCSTYARCYNLPTTVFRFFAAYGPWGRPHSDSMRIASDIVNQRPVSILNNGNVIRDFTYIDDIVDGIVFALTTPVTRDHNGTPFALYNIGRSQPVSYMSYVQAIESALGIKAIIETKHTSSAAAGENPELYADTSKLDRELAYSPVWNYTEAIPLFIDWYKEYYHIG